jgi:predicted DNA-binding protein (MmcQ/YjbR family)
MPNETRSEQLRSFALARPEAWEDHPWGELVVKVGKKIFVFLGAADPIERITVKLTESHPAAMAVRGAEPAGYGLGKAGWVLVPVAGPGAPEVDEIEEWIDESYRAVAPKRLVRHLDHGGLDNGAR